MKLNRKRARVRSKCKRHVGRCTQGAFPRRLAIHPAQLFWRLPWQQQQPRRPRLSRRNWCVFAGSEAEAPAQRPAARRDVRQSRGPGGGSLRTAGSLRPAIPAASPGRAADAGPVVGAPLRSFWETWARASPASCCASSRASSSTSKCAAVAVASPACGKLSRPPQESTIGAAFLTQTVSVNDATVKFEIWCAPRQPRLHGRRAAPPSCS